MSFIATLPEGRAIRDSVECLEGAHVPENIYGVLRFALDVNNIPFRDLDDFFDDFRNVDDGADLYVEDGLVDGIFTKVVKFEYFVTADLLPQFRAVIDKYCGAYYQAKLLYFKYERD